MLNLIIFAPAFLPFLAIVICFWRVPVFVDFIDPTYEDHRHLMRLKREPDAGGFWFFDTTMLPKFNPWLYCPDKSGGAWSMTRPHFTNFLGVRV